jgi:L-2,4-diaminobutyric acid acetyltransferase
MTYSDTDTFTDTETITLMLRPPVKSDGAAIHQLVQACPPLDLNSVYSYLLLAEHFGQTSVVAHDNNGRLLGYISAYVPPDKPDVLFVWQVAVHQDARGQSLGRRMIQSILQRPFLASVQFIETTVGPSNQASRHMFNSVARALSTHIVEAPLFQQRMFGPQGHEDEPLLRIGPFSLAGQSANA